MPKTQEWIKQKLEEERQGWTEYGNRRLTEELEELKQRVSDLEIVYEEISDEFASIANYLAKAGWHSQYQEKQKQKEQKDD